MHKWCYNSTNNFIRSHSPHIMCIWCWNETLWKLLIMFVFESPLRRSLRWFSIFHKYYKVVLCVCMFGCCRMLNRKMCLGTGCRPRFTEDSAFILFRSYTRLYSRTLDCKWGIWIHFPFSCVWHRCLYFAKRLPHRMGSYLAPSSSNEQLAIPNTENYRAAKRKLTTSFSNISD